MKVPSATLCARLTSLLLLLAVFAVPFLPTAGGKHCSGGPSGRPTSMVEYEARNYTIGFLKELPSVYASNKTTTPPWWGNDTTAYGLCLQVDAKLAWDIDENDLLFVTELVSSGSELRGVYWDRVLRDCVNGTAALTSGSIVYNFAYLASIASINANGTTIEIGGTIAMDAFNSFCPTDFVQAGCTETWEVSCSNGYTVSSVEGTEQYWTTGANGMIPATGATDCSVTLTVDAAGYLDVASACIELTLPPPPVVVVAGQPLEYTILVTTTVGQPAVLDASNTTCTAGYACASFYWSFTCQNNATWSTNTTNSVSCPLTGPGNALDVPYGNASIYCFGALIVTDVFGQATNFTDTVSIHIKPAATPVINDGMAEVSALPGTSPVFNSNGTSCPTGNCSSLWALSCPNSRGSFANRTGDSITVAIGRNSSYDVNAASASGPFNCSLTMTVVDPDGLAASTSLILTVVPSPPDCTLAVFSPSILASRTNSQVCSAIKAVRRGKPSKLVTAVTLSLTDADGYVAAINITDILMNKATAGWQCQCRPSRYDNCSCVPNAALLGGGRFSVIPQWRRATRPGPLADTTFQVFFNATTPSGTCSGSAVICSAWDVRPNKPPPACLPYNSTGVTRPALVCI